MPPSTEVGTEGEYSLASGEAFFEESVLWQQPLRELAEAIAECIAPSVLIGIAMFLIWPHAYFPTFVFRGAVAGFVFSFPMFGTLWLINYLAQRNLGFPDMLFPDSLTIRYVLYVVLAICCDNVLGALCAATNG